MAILNDVGLLDGKSLCTAGAVDVVVTTAGGSATAIDSFTCVAG